MIIYDIYKYDFHILFITPRPYFVHCRHVKRISYEVDVDINLVKICLQNLLQFGYILIIPIFLYRLVCTM